MRGVVVGKLEHAWGWVILGFGGGRRCGKEKRVGILDDDVVFRQLEMAGETQIGVMRRNLSQCSVIIYGRYRLLAPISELRSVLRANKGRRRYNIAHKCNWDL